MKTFSTSSPHFWWVISILSAIIIFLASTVLVGQVYCAKLIHEYLSYASLLLSITLSIFAIIYTYSSNVSIQRQFQRINDSVNKIESISKQLKYTSEVLSTVGNDTKKEVSKLSDEITKIKRGQLEINSKLDNRNVTDFGFITSNNQIDNEKLGDF